MSLLTDHMVFSPKYKGKILTGDIAMLAEAIIRKTCDELDIEIIDMAINPDHTVAGLTIYKNEEMEPENIQHLPQFVGIQQNAT